MTTPLRIFSDPAATQADAQLCPLLTPWPERFPGRNAYRNDPYAANGRNYFTLAEGERCDLVVCPFVWREPQHTEPVVKLARQAKAWGRPIAVFCETDSEEPFPLPDILVFRASLRRSRRLPTEFALPAFPGDLLAGKTDTLAVARHDRPIAGFCGCVNLDIRQRSGFGPIVRSMLDWQILARPRVERWLKRRGIIVTRNEGRRARFQALGTIMRSHLVESRFLLRQHHNAFLDRISALPEKERRELVRRARDDFRENVLACDYTLCPRGGGNWSYRLYETLCLGRVPVFFDTDCVLPFESVIRWQDYCVWVDGNEIERATEAIAEHYRAHTAESFAQLGAKCRELWLNYLSLDGFFKNFHRLLPPINSR